MRDHKVLPLYNEKTHSINSSETDQLFSVSQWLIHLRCTLVNLKITDNSAMFSFVATILFLASFT